MHIPSGILSAHNRTLRSLGEYDGVVGSNLLSPATPLGVECTIPVALIVKSSIPDSSLVNEGLTGFIVYSASSTSEVSLLSLVMVDPETTETSLMVSRGASECNPPL